jgi:hypothetical protein
VTDEGRPLYFPEPKVPDLAWGRYQDSGRQLDWLDRSTLPQAVRIREFLNRSLRELPADAGANLAHRFRHDPPFSQVYFELIVGRFLQVLGGIVDHQPIGLGGVNVDWRATFPDGAVYVEATSPAYNQEAALERRRREALLGVIEGETPAGWWVRPRRLPSLALGEPRGEFRRALRSRFAELPDRSHHTMADPLRLEAPTRHGEIVLELWPGDPKDSPIAMASMGAHRDDSPLRVAFAERTKRHQARAFPGESVLLAIDSPFGGPDVESYDMALFGSTLVRIGLEDDAVSYSFRPDGVLAKQRRAEYAGVLAFPQVGMFGATDPIIYHHPLHEGALPAALLDLRQRSIRSGGITDRQAQRTSISGAIGFPIPGDD